MPLAVLCVVLGLKPGILMGPLEPATESLLVDAGYPDAVRSRLLERRIDSVDSAVASGPDAAATAMIPLTATEDGRDD